MRKLVDVLKDLCVLHVNMRATGNYMTNGSVREALLDELVEVAKDHTWTASEMGRKGGRKGGSTKTPRKAKASRINGKKGGRPLKELDTLTFEVRLLADFFITVARVSQMQTWKRRKRDGEIYFYVSDEKFDAYMANPNKEAAQAIIDEIGEDELELLWDDEP